jgi:hypothetical protein
MHSSDGKNYMTGATGTSTDLHGLGTVTPHNQGSLEEMLGMYGSRCWWILLSDRTREFLQPESR